MSSRFSLVPFHHASPSLGIYRVKPGHALNPNIYIDYFNCSGAARLLITILEKAADDRKAWNFNDTQPANSLPSTGTGVNGVTLVSRLQGTCKASATEHFTKPIIRYLEIAREPRPRSTAGFAASFFGRRAPFLEFEACWVSLAKYVCNVFCNGGKMDKGGRTN